MTVFGGDKVDPLGLAIAFYTSFVKEGKVWLVPLAAFNWPFGDALEAVLAHIRGLKHERDGESEAALAAAPSRAESKIRVFAAFLAFIQQRLLVARAERMDRGTRRRYLREHNVEAPEVRVIHLRQSEVRATRGERGEAEREWSCRWLVSGHWRRQWYGRERTHAPRWIAPYVKGDASKPLKPPSRRVFAVVR